ncbi:MAG: FliH/SctL family protein [Lachnospirales bacterium]
MSKIVKANNVVLDGGFAIYDNRYNEIKDSSNAENDETVNISKGKSVADKIINEANLKAQSIYDESHEKGFNEGFSLGEENGFSKGLKVGYDEGYQKALEEAQSVKDEANEILTLALKEKEMIIEKSEEEIVEVLKSIVGHFFDVINLLDDRAILTIVKRGLKNATVIKKATVRVSEKQYEKVMSMIDEFHKIVDGSKEIEVVKDFSLEKNDCVIETEYGLIDCSLSDTKNNLISNLALIFESEK